LFQESQEDSQEQSQPPLASSPDARSAAPRTLKRFLALLGINLVILLVFLIALIAAGPHLIRSARAKFERIVDSEIAPPLPGPPPRVSLPQAQKRAAMPPLPQQPSVSAEELVQKLWTEFDEATWGASFESWSKLHTDLTCKPFRGNMWGLGADAQWSHRCSSGPQLEAAHWSFYVFGLQEPLIPRLEQFDVFTAALPGQTLTAVQSSLQCRLTARFGPGEDRSPKVAANRPPVSQAQSMRWQTLDVEIQLDLSEFDSQRKEGRLRFQARHKALLDALKEDERLRLVGTTSSWYDMGAEIDKQLADELRSDFPQAATMLVKQQPDPDPEKVREAIQKFQTQLKVSQAPGQTGPHAAIMAVQVPPTYWKAEEFHDALLKLLMSVATSPRERQPVLLWAADHLAARLPQVMINDRSQEGHWPEWRTQLASFGVSYEESAFSSDEGPWVYTGILMKRVWTDYGETDWGQRAFLILLSNGWDTSVDCKAGTDRFRAVIERGLEFQKKRPNSKYLLDVQLAVAQAYETWWSLSQAPTGEEVSEVDADVQPAKYREGGEAAHQKAIAAYEQFLQTAPQSDYAAYARRVLPRLKLGIDTGQRRFYCSFAD